MPSFTICYTEHQLREITVTAETKEEAQDMFTRGSVDFNKSFPVPETIETTFNQAQEIKS